MNNPNDRKDEPIDNPSTGLITPPTGLRFVEPYSGREMPLASPCEAVLGRATEGWAPDIDLAPFCRMADHGVSRKHAQITVMGFFVTLKDLNSTNGVIVNGKTLHPHTPYALHDGDRIELGRVTLVFRAT